MPLANFIEENLDDLVAEWSEFARAELPSTGAIDEKSLREGAAAILSSIVEDMRAARTAEQRSAKAQGKRPDDAPKITASAHDHAAERLKSGFTLDQLVAEYRALRASVFRGWTTRNGLNTGQQVFDELLRFDQAMDHSLAEAVSWFNEGVERARDVFVGVLGHDLRDPLSAARAAAELESFCDDDPEQRRMANENLLRNLDRIADMLDGLRDFARTRLGGQLPISPDTTDLKEVCDEIADSFEMTEAGPGIRREYSGDLTGVWDAQRIKQLLSNLTKNAFNYGASKTPVTVAAQGEGEQVTLSVHNFGPPIPEEKQPTIFDPLIRGADKDQEQQRSGESLGLGLYIVKEIAEAHGGSAEVVSDDSTGTTFTVRLPRHSSA